MPFVRRLVTASVCLSVLGAFVACSSEPEPEPQVPSTPEAVVKASPETTQQLGVVEWRVGPGEVEGSVWIRGMDARAVAIQGVGIHAETRGPDEGALTYEIPGPEPLHLHFQYRGGNAISDMDQLERAPRARALLVRMHEDLKQSEGLAPAPSESLTTQSLQPQGGHVGGPLVRQGPALSATPKCLLDKSGNGCYGSLIQVSVGLIGVPICVATAPVTLGAQMALCALGAAGTGGAIVSMREAGCRARPCSERAKD